MVVHQAYEKKRQLLAMADKKLEWDCEKKFAEMETGNRKQSRIFVCLYIN